MTTYRNGQSRGNAMDKIVLKWEMLGFVFSFFVGSMLHFIFEWAGEWSPVALVGAVNESTWEHLKMAYWPMLAWTTIEFAAAKRANFKVQNFMIAKAIGIYMATVSIMALYYGYLAFGGRSNVVYSISIFALAIFLGNLASAKIMSIPQWPAWTRWLGIGLVAFSIACFSLFTYLPPQFFLFQDPVSGGYGIIP